MRLLFVLLDGNVCIWFDLVLFRFRFGFDCSVWVVVWCLRCGLSVGGLLGLLVGCCRVWFVYWLWCSLF